MAEEAATQTNLPEQNAGTAPEQVAPDPSPAQERTWNKAQIVDMMKKRVERSHNAFYKRYGVNNLQELDDKFALASKYDELNQQFAPIQAKNAELMRENSFLRNNVDPNRYADIIAHFKGNNVEFTEEALLEALKTHPEWLKPSIVPTPTTTISSLGAEKSGMAAETEDEKFKRIFGFDN